MSNFLFSTNSGDTPLVHQGTEDKNIPSDTLAKVSWGTAGVGD